MSILTREQFFAKINDRIGDDSSDDAITFMEDMADTYNALSTSSKNEEAAVWKKKYEDNDAAWKKKYQHRFFSGGDMNYSPYKENESYNDDEEIENITIDDLFKKENR